MERKGFAADSIMIILLIGMFVIMLVLSANIYGDIKDTGFFEESGSGYTDNMERTFETLNAGSIILIVGLGLGLIVAGFYIQTHPVVFVVYLVIFIFVLMMTGPMSNIFMGILSTDELADTSNQYATGLNVIGLLPMAILAFGVIAGIVIFSKLYSGGNK
jgi:hypothetical protein